MSLDELSVMDNSKCILRIRGVRAFFSTKYNVKKHKNYKLIAEYSKRNAFDVSEFLSTHLEIKADDEFEVIEIN